MRTSSAAASDTEDATEAARPAWCRAWGGAASRCHGAGPACCANAGGVSSAGCARSQGCRSNSDHTSMSSGVCGAAVLSLPGCAFPTHSAGTGLNPHVCVAELVSRHRQACQRTIHLCQPAGPWRATAPAAVLQPGAAAARRAARARGRQGAYTPHDRGT